MAQENVSNSSPTHAPVNSTTSSSIHSFTAPNTLPSTHQTPTSIYPYIDVTLDSFHHSTDPTLDPILSSNEQIQIENH